MLPNQRNLFDIPEDVAYLNCAYMSPLMRSVVEAGKSGMARKATPWKISADDFFEQAEVARGLAAQLFHSTADDIALVPSASYGIETAARNVPVARGQKILTLAEQFPSHVYPWRRLAAERGAEIVQVPWREDGDWTNAVLSHLNDSVAIAALPNVQWTSGGLLDLERIGQACRRTGAALVLDLTQSLGAYPFDAAKVQPDFAVAAAYKWLLSPYSTGLLYVAPQWHQGKPLEEGWIQRSNARRFAELIYYTDEHLPGARRFDVGEHSNFALLPAFIAALRQILDWGVEQLSGTIGSLTRRLAERAGSAVVPHQFRAPHYLCLKGATSPEALLSLLAEQRIFVSVRGSSVRVTPHVYNSDAEIDRLAAALERASAVSRS